MARTRPNTRQEARQQEIQQRQAGPTTGALGGHSIFKSPNGVEPVNPSSLRRTQRAHNEKEMQELLDDMRRPSLEKTTRVYNEKEMQAVMRMK